MAVQFDNTGDLLSTELGNIGLTAAGFDYFELAPVIEFCIGKIGSHVKVTQSELVKLLCCQVLNVPYQSLYGTSEFYRGKPVRALTGNEELNVEDINRDVLSRLLDAIADFGPERLFLRCSQAVATKLELNPDTVHIDSSSFHYEGQTRVEDGCDIVLDQGYSRDSHPELNQINELMICDEFSHIPLFEKCVSGHVSDKTSFKDVIITYWSLIKEQFKDLRYLVADSALCTSDNAKELALQHLYSVTRIPDSYGQATECFKLLAQEPDKLVPVDSNEPDGVKAMWCGECTIGEQKFKRLLVQNELLHNRKEATITKKANKELEKVQKALTKLETKPCKCMADAQKSIDDITAKLKLVSVSDITYEEVKGHKGRGRPKKDEKPVTIAVKVHAVASINSEAVNAAVENSTYYVICTNDTERKWTMKELLSIYKKQSVVERNWRCLKDKRLLVNTLYLESPSRINALMWVMTLALLIYSATEYLMRKKMEEQRLTVPTPDHKNVLLKVA